MTSLLHMPPMGHVAAVRPMARMLGQRDAAGEAENSEADCEAMAHGKPFPG
jgi:hypothetical protein